MAANPQRNHGTVLLLVDWVECEVDATWLPMLRAWCAAESSHSCFPRQPLAKNILSDPDDRDVRHHMLSHHFHE